MPRVKKPKIITKTIPVFEIYENKYKMMEFPLHKFSENDNTKMLDYLIKREDGSLILNSAIIEIDAKGFIKDNQIRALYEAEQQDGFYGWVKKMRFETVQMVEEPKVKPVEEDTPKKKTRKRK